MRISDHWLRRRIASCVVPVLVLLLVVPFGEFTSAQAVSATQAGNGPSAQNQPQDPGSANNATAANSIPDSPTPAVAAQQAAPQQQNEPLGTAAAPYEKPLGAAVSRPVGAAIAPGKQRRRRSFLIKVGLIVGGAAALGAVVALSKGSPSTPPTH